jgi:hypothetical protein
MPETRILPAPPTLPVSVRRETAKVRSSSSLTWSEPGPGSIALSAISRSLVFRSAIALIMVVDTVPDAIISTRTCRDQV